MSGGYGVAVLYWNPTQILAALITCLLGLIQATNITPQSPIRAEVNKYVYHRSRLAVNTWICLKLYSIHGSIAFSLFTTVSRTKG